MEATFRRKLSGQTAQEMCTEYVGAEIWENISAGAGFANRKVCLSVQVFTKYTAT